MTPTPEPAPTGARGWAWLSPVIFALTGVLFVVSALQADGTDLRPGRYTDLAGLVEADARRVEALNARVARLDAEVAELTAAVDTKRVRELRKEAALPRAAAGFVPLTGPAVTVVLSDAPAEVINASSQDLNLLVVHQQDIQAVVNAMWAGGAQGVTLQGRRIIATTGIKCQGNTVQLDGVPYPQPYVITAVGDQAAILEALDNDSYLTVYRAQAAQPDIRVGWELSTEASVTLPEYTGAASLRFATPL